MTKIIFLLQDQCCLLLCLAWAVDKLPCCHRYVETLDNSTKILMVWKIGKILMVWKTGNSVSCEKGAEKKRFDFNLSFSLDVVVCQKSLIHSTAHCSTAADSWQLDLWLQTRFTLIPTISAHAVLKFFPIKFFCFHCDSKLFPMCWIWPRYIMWQSIKFMHRCFSWASQFSQCSLACAAESRVLRRGRWSSAAFRVRGHQSHWILFSFAFHHNLHFTHRFLCQDLQNFNQYLTMVQLVSKTQFGCSENQQLSFCGRLCSGGSSRGLSAPAASNELWRATQYQLWSNIVTDWKLLAL